MKAIEKLIEYHKHTVALEHIAGRLGWDQETMMPTGSIADRTEEFAAIEKIDQDAAALRLEDLMDAA